ncbi:PTS sugar transporter subunit IIB [Paenibacillus macquariensis]|uniref:PTS system IIB component, L-Asc family n=1 Tax=Paenibacillus macquariensis TaxID=948756 RepID=A0ABY1JP51_9BACL|nr:PTS sugar transporter subunit IIB [Paenibacillus macquariensis]MEC0092033.1 PTS sugar transporter subunit IIB [Paenibacillus macquariensis]OAB37395.1 PTS maltose transporter subunit IIBC [Paenibacillus macquariensis subsp. macquariensis]SIQ52308.1 PTS system IIB component, L-Asc family [Paenibacillus macquariensis]
MLNIVTVCGNGIGSSLMLKLKIEEICAENGIKASVESSDLNAAKGRNCDLIVTVSELASQFDKSQRVAVTRSYINKKKIQEDILETLQELSN